MREPAIPVDHLRKCGQKPRTILVIADDTLTGIPAPRQVIDGVGKFKTERASHAATLLPRSV
jgi:hypothetical protein